MQKPPSEMTAFELEYEIGVVTKILEWGGYVAQMADYLAELQKERSTRA